MLTVPHHYDARPYQATLLSDIRDKWFVVMKWARRAGKGLTTFVYAAQRMTEETMGVVIIYPTAEQGYRSFWNNIENDGFKTIEHIPPELRAKFNDTKDNMSMVLKNGSTLDLVGANADPEKFRGNNVKLYIISEFVDVNSGILDIIEPIVIANGGQIIIESTVKQDGISGATFLRLFKAAEKDPEMYASRVDAREYMTEQQLDRARQACINKYGNDFMFRQEYLLDEGQALATSYYGNILAEKERLGQIGRHPYNPDYPVFSSWDLGRGDSTAGWFFQYYDKKLHLIDYYETHETADALLVQLIKSKPYNYAWHFFPHDGARRDSDDIQRIIKFQKLGLPNCSLLRRRDRESGLHDAIELMRQPSTTLHKPFLESAIDKLKIYKRKWNEFTGDYLGPDHASESDCADGYRYVSDAIKQYFDPLSGRFLIDQPKEKAPVFDDDWAGVSWDF